MIVFQQALLVIRIIPVILKLINLLKYKFKLNLKIKIQFKLHVQI